MTELARGLAKLQMEANALESDDRIVIALDFGTTYSGIAYAFNNPGKKAEVRCIMDWPGLEGHRQPKVPTLICYDEADPTKFKWGGQVGWRDEAVTGVKLLLDPDQIQPSYLPTTNVKRDLKKLPKTPVDVAADFIGAIYGHALEKISNAVVKDYFDLCQKQFVLSVPAVWSDKAKHSTMLAAKKAGIHPVTLIKEPEAAALYTLHVQERSLGVGDAFVVCDAGGGTVDLITYEIKEKDPLLELAEVVPGSGGMAGSLGLNKRFEEAVRNLVGEDQWLSLRRSVGWSKALTEFDKTIKIAYRGDDNDDHFVNFPQADLEDDPEVNLVSNCWSMTGKDVRQIFDPLVKDILRLIEEQVKSALIKRGGAGVKGIFLVGGFGSSLYLKACVEKQHPGIQVIQPDDAWAAIVKGAVLTRLPEQPTVVTTQAARHYGVSAGHIYEAATDKGRPTYVNRSDGTTRCKRMTWYIYQGEDLQRDTPIKFPFFRSIPIDYDASDLLFTDELYESDARSAPTHEQEGEDMKINCVCKSDLSSVDKSRFQKVTGPGGKMWYRVHFDLTVSTKDANMRFGIEVDGNEMGSVDVTY